MKLHTMFYIKNILVRIIFVLVLILIALDSTNVISKILMMCTAYIFFEMGERSQEEDEKDIISRLTKSDKQDDNC